MSIIEPIVCEMEEELDKRDYIYEESALHRIVEESLEAKQNLISLFSKHPNWNPEKLMIQFDADMERAIDTSAAGHFGLWLWYSFPMDWRTFDVQNIVDFIQHIETQFFNEGMQQSIEKINAINENFKLRTNMKSSKAIGKICREMGWDKLPEYNKKYAEMCDGLNPIKIKRHTCISVNPIDFLLMSHGNSWTSCHYIGDDRSDAGCYSSGTISYMLDEDSFVFYTVDASYNGDKIETAPKIQRQVFGYNDEVICQSRLYPQSNDNGADAVYDNIRAIVQNVIADCLGKPNLWIKSHSDVEEVVEHGDNATCYPDWEYGNPGSAYCSISTHKERAEGKKNRKIVFGAMPICITCGCCHATDFNISCCRNGRYCCGDCGCELDEDEALWIDYVPYCNGCADRCANCGEVYKKADMEYVHGEYVCTDCLHNSCNYERCDNCNEWCREEDMTWTEESTAYCYECRDDNVCYCYSCDACHDRENLYYDEETCEYYCEDCYAELLEEREEQELAS